MKLLSTKIEGDTVELTYTDEAATSLENAKHFLHFRVPVEIGEKRFLESHRLAALRAARDVIGVETQAYSRISGLE